MKNQTTSFNYRSVYKFITLLFIGLVISTGAFAASVTFNQTNSTDWATGSNWSSGTVPTSADVITIAASKTVVIANGTTVTVERIILNAGASLTNNGTLTIAPGLNSAGATTNSALTINGTNTFDNEGTLTVTSANQTTVSNAISLNGTGNTLKFNGTNTLAAKAGNNNVFAAGGSSSSTISGIGFTIGSSGSMAGFNVFSITSSGASVTIDAGTTLNIYMGAYNAFYLAASVSIINNGTINFYTTTTGTTPKAISTWQTSASSYAATFTNYGTLLMSGFEQPTAFSGSGGTSYSKFENKSTGTVTSTYPGISSGSSSSTTGIYSAGNLPNVFINSGAMNFNASYRAIALNAKAYAGSFTNTGTINITKGSIQSGGTLGTSSTYQTIDNNSGGVINFNYGVSVGTTSATDRVIINNNSGATINGSCTFADGTLVTYSGSTLSPGDYSGGVSGIGKMILTPTSSAFTLNGNVNIQVNGKTTAGTDYDQISFASTCALTLSSANTLTVTAGYTPAASDRISLISTTTKSGAFATTTVPAGWHIDYATATDIAAKFAAISWTGSASDGLWSSANNWSSKAVPISTSDVSIGAYTVTNSGSAAVNSLSLTGSNLTNSGTLTIAPASSKDGINLNASTFDNEGTLSINTSYRCIELSGTNALTFNGTTTFAGSTAFVTNNSSATTISGTGFSLGSAGTPTSYGLISTTSTSSTFTINSGTTLNVYSNASNVIYMASSASITNNGTLNIYTSTTGTGVHALQIWETIAGINATFTNGSTGTLLLSGYEQPTVFGGGNTGSTGYCKFDNTGTATITTSSAAGTLGLYSTSNLPNVFTNSGTLNISATYRAIVLNAKTYNGSFTNTGTLNITKGLIFSAGASASDYNTIDNNSPGKINFNYGFPAGSTTATSAASINNNYGATINGSCTFAASTLVTNSGSTLSPGDYSAGVSGIGKMIITPVSSAFTLAGNVNLQVNEKTTAGTDYDQIAFASTCALTLSGSPVINMTVGYTPTYNDRISVISSNTLSGSLGSASLPTGWVTDYASTDVAVKYPSVVPGAPATVTATAGNTRASIAFTAPASDGGSAITSYTVTSSPGGLTASGATSPLTVSGLTNTQAYTFTVTATNSVGTGSGTTSSSVIPDATANIINISTSTTTSGGSLNLTPVSDVVVDNAKLLTINSTTIINSLTIAGGGQVTNTSSLTASSLTINSDGTNGTGTYNDNGGTTSVTSATVKQYLSSSRNWYMSSPVSGASSLPTVDGVGSLTFYSYPESDSRQAAGVKDVYAAGAVWNTVSGATTMTFGTGYIVKPSAATSTVIFSGTGLNTGNQTISGLTYTSANPKHGFNLIGNPYPSYLNVLPSISANAAGLEPTVWYRTRDAAGYYHCETVNTSDGFGTNSSNTGRATGYIPPMQGFWVRTISNNQPITFYNSNRSHTTTVTMPGIIGTVPTTPLKAPTLKNETYGLLGLNVFNGITGDETIIKFYSGATNNLDAYDSGKMSNGNVNIPELFTVVDGSQLAINTMNSIPYDTEIALGFTTGKSGDFTINASLMSNFAEGTQILLKDNIDPLNPVITDLVKQSYSFNSEITTSNTSRFTLIFKAPSVATVINPESNGNVWISTRNGQIVINGTANRATLEVFNTVGQKVISRILSGTNIHENNNLPVGAYLVKLTNEGKSITKKIIIN